MNKRTVLIGLSAGLALQVLVLLVEYAGAVYPIWTGQLVSLKVVPVDPRDLFRGNYARLNYEISGIPAIELPEQRINQYVYVRLKPDANGLYGYDGISLIRPVAGLFIRGRYQSEHRVKYGIEAYFAPKEKAIALETQLRSGGVAKVMIATNGKAALLEVMSAQQP